MKKIVEWFLYIFFNFVFWFRYKVTIKGLDKMNPDFLSKPGGVLFLPNHPAVFIDPSLVTLAIWRKYEIRPMVIDYMFNQPLVYPIMKLLNALSVPNFSSASNSLKKKKGEEVIQEVIQGLKRKENFMIYPAGRLKSSGYEQIAGTSAPHRIIQEAEGLNIVLVRTTGLWGSKFSKAATGKTPSIAKSVLWGIGKALKNFLFFIPRRPITIEFVPVGSDFPRQNSRKELNDYLEKWYNAPFEPLDDHEKNRGEPISLVSYSIWSNDFLEIEERKVEPQDEINVKKIPEEILKKVKEKISQLSDQPVEKISLEDNLSIDIGLDSIDTAELSAFLQDEFGVDSAPVHELTTVKKVAAIANKNIVLEGEEEEKEGKNLDKWFQKQPHKPIKRGEGETIITSFLDKAYKNPKKVICADARSGILTYKQVLFRVILLAEYIRKLEGKYIGIMLPASVGAYILSLAVQLAGKVPLMVNWTVGARHLDSVVELSHVKTVLSSWAFIDRLENVDFSKMEDKMVMLEDVAKDKLSLKEKIKGYLLSLRSKDSVITHFGIDSLTENDEAVLLFTSGTESLPKGVPLTHGNILFNHDAALNPLPLFEDDSLLSILPPFHAFGLVVTGFLPFIWGVKVAFSPDPTNGNQVVKAAKKWKTTIVCGAPTFLKGILKAAKPEDLASLRICVTGAEKAPPELFKKMKEMGKEGRLLEGYGITECSPVITMNQLEEHLPGVGRPLPGLDLCIVDHESHEVLSKGERGLILVKGKSIFSGYLNHNLKSPFLLVKGSEWYNTGDLGFIDPKTDSLIISGRLKRFVKVGGEMVSLSAMEEILQNAAEEKGWPLDPEGPSLAIIAKEKEGEKPTFKLISKFSVSEEEANSVLRNKGMGNIARISSVHEVNEIPLMGTGKVHYRKLEAEYFS